MEKEKVIFDDTEHEIEVKPVTLVFNKSFGESKYLERTMITPEMTLEHFNSLEEIDHYTAKFFKFVIDDFPYEVNKENLSKCQMGFRHLIGLFSLTIMFMIKGTKFGWKYPETGLHPKYQANIADAMIILSNPSFLKDFIEK
jgi:hypothetical protein